jgi:serine/threonine-protein kinase RsbW
VSVTVDLSVPAEPELIALVRFAAASVAAHASFSVEEIEDLRLAVDELCLSLIGGEETGRLDLTLVSDDDVLEVSCTVDLISVPTPSDDDPTGEWSARILEALVDESGREPIGDKCRGWLRKRRSRAAV